LLAVVQSTDDQRKQQERKAGRQSGGRQAHRQQHSSVGRQRTVAEAAPGTPQHRRTAVHDSTHTASCSRCGLRRHTAATGGCLWVRGRVAVFLVVWVSVIRVVLRSAGSTVGGADGNKQTLTNCRSESCCHRSHPPVRMGWGSRKSQHLAPQRVELTSAVKKMIRTVLRRGVWRAVGNGAEVTASGRPSHVTRCST